MIKNISRIKVILALISLVITFFIWQQGLRESLNRPSVSFDISQKEKEIAELSIQSIPSNFKKFVFINDPIEEIQISLSNQSFNELTERNKLILLISSDWNKLKIDEKLFTGFKNKEYSSVLNDLAKKSKDQSYSPNFDRFDKFKNDKFLYHLLSKKFSFDDDSLITQSLYKKMFLKILAIRFIPLLTILVGSILVLKTLWNYFSSKKLVWKEIIPLDLDLIDMVLINRRRVCCPWRSCDSNFFNQFS